MTKLKRSHAILETSELVSPPTEDEWQLEQLEPGWGKAAIALRTGSRLGHKPRSLRLQSLVEVHELLEARKRRFERGDSMELLHAIALCAEENVPLPTWLAVAFGAAFDSVVNVKGTSPSLESAFKSNDFPIGPPTKVVKARKDWELGHQLWSAVWNEALERPDIASIDAALESALRTKKWGVAKTKARRLVLLIDKNHSELTGTRDLSRFFEVRRKLMKR